VIYAERDFPPTAKEVRKVLAIVGVPALAELQRDLLSYPKSAARGVFRASVK
jgi:hypothetical protein